MDEITTLVVEFINTQPKNIRDKYLAYFTLKTNSSPDAIKDVYSKNFDYEDLRLFTSGLTNAILGKIKTNQITSELSNTM